MAILMDERFNDESADYLSDFAEKIATHFTADNKPGEVERVESDENIIMLNRNERGFPIRTLGRAGYGGLKIIWTERSVSIEVIAYCGRSVTIDVSWKSIEDHPCRTVEYVVKTVVVIDFNTDSYTAASQVTDIFVRAGLDYDAE